MLSEVIATLLSGNVFIIQASPEYRDIARDVVVEP